MKEEMIITESHCSSMIITCRQNKTENTRINHIKQKKDVL